MYYVYMLRCEDNSIYTGLTVDINRRLDEHLKKDRDKCDKYTMRHSVSRIEALWTIMDDKYEERKIASKLEYHIKKLSKANKELLIKDNESFERLLGKKLECDKYNRMDESFIKDLNC